MLIQHARLVDAGGEREGDILIRDGRIAAVGEGLAAALGEPVLDAAGLVAMPAFIDLHTHFRTPGFEHKETVETGSRAAARGGEPITAVPTETEVLRYILEHEVEL